MRGAGETQRSNLARAAAILSGFDGENTPRATAAILAALGIGRSTGFGLVRQMVRDGWLERVDHGLLRLGPRAADLAFTPLEASYARLRQEERVRFALPSGAEAAAPAQGAATWDPSLVDLVDNSAFRRPGPYRIGFANASSTNPWRRALMQSMLHAVRLFGDQIEIFDTLDAGDDPSTQIQQVDRLVDEGIDLLIISATTAGEAGLSDRLAALAAGGLPIVAVDRRPRDPSSLVSFVTASDWTIGHVSALWLAEHLKGRGRIWMLSGLEGTSPAIRRQSAALEAFSEFPGLKVEAVTYSGWTEEGGRAAIERLARESGAPPDGIWCDSGLQGVGSLQYFLDRKLPVPAHTGGDLNRMYKLALHNKLPMAAVDYPAAMGARAVETAVDILSGKPVLRRNEVPVQVILPRGMETRSVKADIWAELHVRWDLPDDAVLSQGPSLRHRDDPERLGKATDGAA